MQIYCPKKCPICPTFGIKTHSYHKKHCFKWPTPLEWYDRGSLLSLVLGVSTYLNFGARFFSTQWPPYGAHILQGLLSKASLGLKIALILVYRVENAYFILFGPVSIVPVSPALSLSIGASLYCAALASALIGVLKTRWMDSGVQSRWWPQDCLVSVRIVSMVQAFDPTVSYPSRRGRHITFTQLGLANRHR